jgi:hypothetical protein
MLLNLGSDCPNSRLFEQKLKIDTNRISIGIVNGFSPFSLIISKYGDYEEFWPPFSDEDFFVKIIFDKPVLQDTVNHMVETYLFELNSSLNLAFAPMLNQRQKVIQNLRTYKKKVKICCKPFASDRLWKEKE